MTRLLRVFDLGMALLAAVVAIEAGAAPVSARDDTGAVIVLPAPATRIISLAPSATELVFAAGGGSRVIAVVDTSDWPTAVRTLPRVGDSHAVDLERVFALKPDLVVTWPYTVPAQVETLRRRGIAVFAVDPKSIDGIAGDLERLGVLLDTQREARVAAEAFRARVATLRERHAGVARPRVFYEIWDAPLYTIGGKHLISGAIALCGGENVFANLTLPAPAVTVEAVLAAKPDVIVAGSDQGARPAWLDAWRKWPELPATAHGQLYAIDADLLHRSGPRFVDGVEALCGVLDAARADAGKRQ